MTSKIKMMVVASVFFILFQIYSYAATRVLVQFECPEGSKFKIAWSVYEDTTSDGLMDYYTHRDCQGNIKSGPVPIMGLGKYIGNVADACPNPGLNVETQVVLIEIVGPGNTIGWQLTEYYDGILFYSIIRFDGDPILLLGPGPSGMLESLNTNDSFFDDIITGFSEIPLNIDTQLNENHLVINTQYDLNNYSIFIYNNNGEHLYEISIEEVEKIGNEKYIINKLNFPIGEFMLKFENNNSQLLIPIHITN